MNKPKALITGGTQGIGRAIAEEMLAEGKEIWITGRSCRPELNSSFNFLKVDFTDEASTMNFLKEINLIDFDILINNAGINKIDPFLDISLNCFREIIKVNLEAPFRTMQTVIPGMKKKGWGRIVNITSIFGNISKEYRASYSASKFGLDGLSVAAALELAKSGILINCVGPGFIETDLTASILGAEGMSSVREKVPLGRLGQPLEVAKFVAWLSSANNTFINGQNLIIDGGVVRG